MELAIDQQGQLVRHTDATEQTYRCLVCDQPVSIYTPPTDSLATPSIDGKFVHPTSDPLVTEPCRDDKTIALSLLRRFPPILSAVCSEEHVIDIRYETREVVTRDPRSKKYELELFHDFLGIEDDSDDTTVVAALRNIDFYIHTPAMDVVINVRNGEQLVTPQELRSYQQGTIWLTTTPRNTIESYKRGISGNERTRLHVESFHNLHCERCHITKSLKRVNSTTHSKQVHLSVALPSGDSEREAEVRMFYMCYSLVRTHVPRFTQLEMEFRKIAMDLGISLQ